MYKFPQIVHSGDNSMEFLSAQLPLFTICQWQLFIGSAFYDFKNIQFDPSPIYTTNR